jgi:mannosyl-3-phosphoglycerate phosphatase
MPQPSLVVVSDLDGTLLDHTTYDFAPARRALDRLRNEGIPLVLCTSKTRAEVEPLRDAMGNRDPFIVENGGGVFIPVGYFPFDVEDAELRGDYWVVSIGDRYADLVGTLERASLETGVRVQGFATMSDEAVAEATSLSLAEAHLARDREFDEPFVILDAERGQELLAAIKHAGKQWTRGGRFYNITGASNKALAVSRLAALYRRHLGVTRTVGLGDAPNDAGFLSVVDIPIVVASPHATRLRALVPRARVTDRPGPAGWNDAVLTLLDQPRAQ